MTNVATLYMDSVYDRVAFRRAFRRTLTRVRRLHDSEPFDAIAFRGSSGAAMAYPLSLALGVHLIHVRKRRSGHGAPRVEGLLNARSYIIVDDFVDSGNTIREIVRKVKSHSGAPAPVLRAVVLYDMHSSNAWWAKEHCHLKDDVGLILTGTD